MIITQEYNLNYYWIILTNKELIQDIRISKEFKIYEEYKILYSKSYDFIYFIKDEEVVRIYNKKEFKKARKKLWITLTK